MLSGRMMEELANIINCVTGDVRQRRTIYEADQDFERFGKTLIANFKDTATLWEFLRASLRQCHINVRIHRLVRRCFLACPSINRDIHEQGSRVRT